MRGMSEIMAHTITLHLLDAPGRVHRFMRKHPELVDRIPSKELASYLNLSAETLSRLKQARKDLSAQASASRSASTSAKRRASWPSARSWLSTPATPATAAGDALGLRAFLGVEHDAAQRDPALVGSIVMLMSRVAAWSFSAARTRASSAMSASRARDSGGFGELRPARQLRGSARRSCRPKRGRC